MPPKQTLAGKKDFLKNCLNSFIDNHIETNGIVEIKVVQNDTTKTL